MGTKGDLANLSQLGLVTWSWEAKEIYELGKNEETKTYLETLFALFRTGFEAFRNIFVSFTLIISLPSKIF